MLAWIAMFVAMINHPYQISLQHHAFAFLALKLLLPKIKHILWILHPAILLCASSVLQRIEKEKMRIFSIHLTFHEEIIKMFTTQQNTHFQAPITRYDVPIDHDSAAPPRYCVWKCWSLLMAIDLHKCLYASLWIHNNFLSNESVKETFELMKTNGTKAIPKQWFWLM